MWRSGNCLFCYGHWSKYEVWKPSLWYEIMCCSRTLSVSETVWRFILGHLIRYENRKWWERELPLPNFSYHSGTEENRKEWRYSVWRRDFCQKTRRQERTVLHSECEIPYFSEEKKNRLSVKLGLSLRVSDVVWRGLRKQWAYWGSVKMWEAGDISWTN